MEGKMKLFRDYYESVIAQHGEKMAYRDPAAGVSYTYDEFNVYVRKIMTKLSGEGIKKGDTCLIAMSHNVGYVAVMHACLLSGICYVPQAADYPKERLDMIAEDAQARIIIRDDFLYGIEDKEAAAESVAVLEEDLSVIIYTSGSTGKPKGVVHTHISFATAMDRYQRYFDLTNEDIYGSNAPFYFVAHMQDVFSPFLHGITTVLIPDELRGDPAGLSSVIDRENITTTYIPPKVLKYFRKQGSSLRRVLTAGERVSNIYPEDFEVVNGYGMSETAAGVLGYLIDQSYDNTPIGKPLGDEAFYVLDENGHTAEEGELCIAGRLSVGYRGLSELTAQTFVSNPFVEDDGFEVLLHTGDLVRRLPDGSFLYLNRKDWMIKINGQRVEPGEIEAALRSIDEITEAAVKDFTQPDGQTIIAAYYITEDKNSLDETKIRSALSESLPGYMIPAYFISLERMPVNANGKLDRKALAAPKLSDYTTKYIAPETDMQKEICDAFAKILGLEKCGLEDDFFSLGGDSIKVLVLQNALDQYGITKADIFAAHTPRKLALKISDNAPLPSLADFAKTAEARESYPLTESQMSIYLDSGDPDRQTVYNNTIGLFLPEETDAGRIAAACERVFAQYPVLSCHVVEEGGIPSLAVDASMKITVAKEQTNETDRGKIAKEFIRPFDLASGPLLRAAVYANPEGLFLLIDAHHIISDGTSISLLVENIGRAINGEELKKEQISNLTLADYENERLSEVKEKDNAFYRRMLDNLDGETELYADDDPALKELDGKLGVYEALVFDQEPELAIRIQEKVRSAGITESTVFMSAYIYMLRLLSGQKNVLYFAGENGRNDPLLTDTFGMMVHNIPISITVNEEQSVTDYMQAVQKTFYDCVSHDHAAYSELLGEYHIRPEYSFVYQGEMLDGAVIDGRSIPLEIYKAEDAMDNLTLHVMKQRGGDYLLHFEYGAGLYTRDTIRRMSELFVRILNGLTSDDRLCEIPLAGASDIAEQKAHNDTARDYEITDIVTLFKKQVKLHPDNNAVFYKGQMLSYRQVDEISDSIAAFLRKKGIGAGKVVSILIPRSLYMVTASIGVLKTGAAYQPLDPSYPSERLTFMMQDADAAYLIADKELLSCVPEYRGGVLLTGEIDTLPKAKPLTSGTPDKDSLFILLYTSGSTGTPKGVKLLHKNIANFCGWYREFYELSPSSRVAAYASYGFDADMMDLYPALTTGACVYVIEEEIRLDLLALESYFNTNEITHSFMTTQVGRQFYTMASPKALRFLSTGGEKLVPLAPVDGAAPFYNLYGPTECTILTTYKLMDRLYDRVPIGQPLANYKVYVRDEYGRQLPALVPGEMLISGAGVSAGYLNRDDLTEKVFIKNEFCDEPGYERAYRSGDVVRLLANGEVDFIGRNDGQVKVRGFRIELTEVEGIIREFAGIKDATVQAFEDAASGEKYIAAYIVSDEEIDIDAMNRFIREEKPPYMVPAVTMQIDAIPLNQNQKVNKKALPVPQRQNVEIIEPKNETQQTLFDCIADVVGHKDFGITTDLADAGLSSIGSIKLNAVLSKIFDVVFTTRDLKEQNTIEKLEEFISKARDGKATGPDLSVQADYPLSKTQEGIYVECIAQPNSTVYNIPILLEIDRALDIDKLRSAIVAAVNAHPFIKTRLFINDDGDVRMRRMDADMSFVSEEIPLQLAKSIDEIEDSLVTPFNLIGGRLYRVAIIETEDDRRYLFIEMHHLISDGTSMGIILNDISRAYMGEELAAESYSGFEVVLTEAHVRTAQKLEETKSYYEKLLDEAETQSLPVGDITDSTAKKDTDTAGSVGVYEIEGQKADVNKVRSFCEKNALSMNAFFSAAFGHMLGAYLNTQATVFAGIYNGRSDSRLTDTVAMLVKTLPIVAGAKAGESVVDHVKAMGKQLSDTQARDLYSFAEVSRQLGVNADVMFAYQGDDFTFDSLCGKPAKMLSIDLGAAKAPLNVNVFLTDGAIRYNFEYDSNRFSEGYIRDMAQSLDMAVSQMLKKERMSEISFVTEEMKKTLAEFNDTKAAVRDALAPQRMEAAAKEYGDKIAVIAQSGDEKLTFKELNSRANKIANSLIANGSKKGARIGLYMDRTADVYAIRQGIMKASCAFVSLEPEYPDERITFILQDAGISLLITTNELYKSRATLFDGIVKVIALSDIYESDTSDEAPAKVRLKENDPAYCIYTSGSTGNPKGVEITHKNLRNLLDYNDKNELAHAYVDNSTVFLGLAAITFDVSIIEEMMPIYHGKTVVMATQDEIHNPMMLIDTMKKCGVDMMKCTPSYMLSILEVQQAADVFKQLSAVILGAEPFPEGMYEKLRDAGFNGIVFNSYGPTETCVSVSIGTLDGSYVTIGGPNANTYFLIRDRFGNVLPKYMRGELVIAGDCVGNGYVGLPEKTKEVYITVTKDGKELPAYRSGDIAYFNAAGEIMHCGRNDNQVKIRGLRVELDGIENTMNTYPGIERSVVLVLGEGDGKYLCGYYVAKHPVDENELSAHLRKTLTAYMVPSVYVYLEKLPLTVNGKVNKKALPRPEAKKKEHLGRSAATDLQREIAEMFAKALGIDEIGVDEDFFEAGGTSMLASKVAMSAMVKGMPIAYQDVFAYPTVEQMEAHVLQIRRQASGKPEAKADEPESSAPCHRIRQDGTVDAVLAMNSMDEIDGITEGLWDEYGTVLLTGATGFLGVHVLGYLLEHTQSPVICLIRKGGSETPQKRLQSILMYYFGKPYLGEFENGRVRAIDGDITDHDLMMGISEEKFDMVINCAACVKHFAADDILERVNVTGVKNLIALCEKVKARLIQVSTVSVAGENVDHALPEHLIMDETMLYFGQDLSNQYVHSKFEAEQAMLAAIAKGTLDGKIIRVGNLMSRLSDGEFQANAVTSGFMRNLRGYVTIGAYPVSEMARPVEFSPIDTVAEAVVRLSATPKQYSVFHAVNGHWLEMGDLIDAMQKVGFDIDVVSGKEFEQRLKEAMENEEKNMLVSGLISYLSSDTDSVRVYIGEKHDFSTNALYRLGFRWPLTDETYLKNAIEALDTFGFFKGDLA